MEGQLTRVMLLLFVAGPSILLWLHALRRISRYRAMRTWPRTMAVVQDARARAVVRGYVPLEVLASYEAGGKIMKSWCQVPMRARPAAQRKAAPPAPYDYLDEMFAVGNPIEVFYNPEQPAEVHYLMPALRSSFVAIAAGFAWLMACAAALLL